MAFSPYTNKPAKFLYSKCTQKANNVTCEALNISKVMRERKSVWPAGPFAIPMSHLGCPEPRSKGWSTGFILLKSGNSSLRIENDNNQINGNSLYLHHDLKINFCVKRKRPPDLDTGAWIPGNYSIYTSGNACPEGFTQFNRTIYIDKHTVYGEVPRFTFEETPFMNYINFTMCDREITSSDKENTTQTFSMLETAFTLENNRNNSCPFVNGSLNIEERLFGDSVSKHCVYTPGEDNTDKAEIEHKHNFELISAFTTSKGSFPNEVKQRLIGSSTHLRKTGSLFEWYQFDFLRTLTVSKILLKKTKFYRMSDDPILHRCFYDDVKWSFLHLDANICEVNSESYRHNYTILMSHVRGRYITLVYNNNNMFLEWKFQVFVTEIETLDGEDCDEDLGMIDGSILDGQITASSWLNQHLPSGARPFSTGWCAKPSDKMPWILVDLIAITTLEGVVFYNKGSSTFNLYFGTTVDNLQLLKNTTLSLGQEERTFILPNLIKTRYLKLEFQNRLKDEKNCLQFELRGCKISGVPTLSCQNDSKMFVLSSGIKPGKKRRIDIWIESKFAGAIEECSNICLISDNCTITNYDLEKEYDSEIGCSHFESTPYENWLDDANYTGIISAKLCAEDVVEMFPSFVDQSGAILANVEVIKSAPSLITTIGYPFSYGSAQHYKWIVKYPEQTYIKMIFTNMSLALENLRSCNKLYISTDIKNDTAGITVDNTFNDRAFIIETSESLLILTFSSCLSQTAITSRGFRAIITKEEIPSCLSINTVSWKEGRNELCNKPKMFLTSMSLLNVPFTTGERWIITAEKHHSIQIEILDFYVICATDLGEFRSTFSISDSPDNKMYCNTIMPPSIIRSRNSNVTIIFRKYEDPERDMIRREGFRLQYHAINHEIRDVMFLDISQTAFKVCSKEFNKCYNIHSSLVTWKQAERHCWERKQTLVSVHSRNELVFIHYLLREKRYRENGLHTTEKQVYGPRDYSHIGLSRSRVKQSQKQFVWANAAPLTFTAWGPGYPTSLDCIRTNFHPFNTNITWETEECTHDTAHYFICEDESDDSGMSTDNDESDICGIDISRHRRVNVTYSGKECQRWDALTSDANENFIGRFPVFDLPTTDSNFCQDPSSVGVLWCYTFESEPIWEPCFLQQPIGHDDFEKTQNFSNNHFACDNETAIPAVNRCDGVFDCKDYSDETLCMNVVKDHMMLHNRDENVTKTFPTKLEKGSYFHCGTNEWISIIAKCDGFIDCLDASDELNCSRSQEKCNENEFTCADGNCVHMSQVCDLIADCENSEDEFCEHTDYGFDKFLCENKQYIHLSKRCNGVPDCPDGSDEGACESCKDSFRCDMNTCIMARLKCDGYTDCFDESDEKSCFHDDISSCGEWWDLGYRESGEYIIDGIKAGCDFHSLETKFKMIIHNIDVNYWYVKDERIYGRLFSRSTENPTLMLNDVNVRKKAIFQDIHNRNDSECILQVKQDCNLPESIAFDFDGKDQLDVYDNCRCIVLKLIADSWIYRYVPSSWLGLFREFQTLYRRKYMNDEYIGSNNLILDALWELNFYNFFSFESLSVSRCDKSIWPHGNGGKKFRWNTARMQVDHRIIEKTISIGITVGPITCSYDSKEYRESNKFYCERERRSIPLSARCLFDTDASGETIGCRSGSHLQNCGNYTCPRDTVKCPGSYCIPLRFLCDGINQCQRGEDENNCTCTDIRKEILILSETKSHQSERKEVADLLARQLYTSGSIIRILHFEVNARLKQFPIDIKLLEIREQAISPNKAVQENKKCRYKSLARNILQSIKFSKSNLKGIIFIEDSVASESVAKILFSNLSKPAFPIYRIYKDVEAVNQRTYTYNHVKNVPINKWNHLTYLGNKMFPEICKAGVQVPCAEGYRCLSSKQCLPLEQVCDGVFQCRYGDDERLCDFRCPLKCDCVGLVVNCRAVKLPDSEIQMLPFNSRSIDLSQNPSIRNILYHRELHFPFMLKLNVSTCEIKLVKKEAFLQLYNLRSMDLGYNKLRRLPENLFSKLEHLIELNLEGNSELEIIASSAFHGLKRIRSLRITGTNLRTIESFTFFGLRLQEINISNNKIEEIENNAFNNISVRYIDFSGNNIYKFNKLIFNNVSSLLELRTPAFKFCCIRPCYVDENDCYPAKNEFSSCGDLMRHPVLQAALWIVGIAALFGNIGSIVYRLVYDRERLKIGYGIFVTNLAAADFLMGVYLIIIATMDSLYRNRYIFMDNQWRNSTLCVAAGVLSTVSSEASVLFLCFITLDRLLVIKYPFGTFRFGPRGAYISCCISWTISITLALIPAFYTRVFENKFYSRSGVCVALPLTREKPPGWVYSVSIFVGLNFCTLVLVAAGQLFIFMELRKTSSRLKKTQIARKRDLQVARNLILVVTTDFLCWFPIGLMGIMALNGYTISGDVYAWTAVFILPFNSALNPVLYTLTAIIGNQSFNPSTDEQSRVDIRRETGSGILRYQNICRTVCLKQIVGKSINARSIGDILRKDGKLSVDVIAAIAFQLSTFLQVLHESSIALKELHDNNVFIKFEKNERKNLRIIIDTKTSLEDNNRLIQQNMYQYGILLRKMIAHRKRKREENPITV